MVYTVSNSLTTDCYMAEDFDYLMMKIPTIYLLDCTLNDCHLVLKSVDQVLVDLYFPGLNVQSYFYIYYGIIATLFLNNIEIVSGLLTFGTIFPSCTIIVGYAQMKMIDC